MRVVIQRVDEASVKVDNKIVGQINKGFMLLVGFTHTDTLKDIDYMVEKIINLRIFDDENGVMNKSLLDVNGNILSISQFTLYANTIKGRRPNYLDALGGDEASKLYNIFNMKLKEQNIKVETGIFGAEMKVSLINDGPVTIILERNEKNEEKK